MGFVARLLGIESRPRELCVDLAALYRDESMQATQLREQATRARYPQAATALNRLAEMETRHADWLRERLIALGGDVPNAVAPPVAGNNQWERAVAAAHSAQAKRRRFVEQIGRWDPEEPETVALLQRIQTEDAGEQAVYDELIMRSDPQALD